MESYTDKRTNFAYKERKMKNSGFMATLTKVFKWLIYIVGAVLAFKLIMKLAILASATMMIATAGAWFVGLVALGGLGVFAGIKLLGGKKKR